MTAVIIWAVRATTQAHKLCLFLLSKIRNEPGGINRCKHITSHQFTKKSSKERKALETSLEDYYILYCFGGGVPEKRHFHCRDFIRPCQVNWYRGSFCRKPDEGRPSRFLRLGLSILWCTKPIWLFYGDYLPTSAHESLVPWNAGLSPLRIEIAPSPASTNVE